MGNRKKAEIFLNEKMTEEEKTLLEIANNRLVEKSLHLRLASLRIHEDGSISTEFVPPVHKYIKEEM